MHMMFVFLNMFTKTFLISTIFLVVSLASASSPSKGLTAPLIPPTSPRSPFYTEILKANNISTTENVTLNRSQYMEWLITKYTQNKQGEVSFQRDAGHHVVDMYLGSPEQRVYGIFDTSSDIVWIQCAKQAKQNEFVYYNYSESSTYKHVPCDDVKCNTSYANIIGCKGKLPPCAFMATYENATVAYGPLATDVVTFKPESEIVQDFIFGCSVKNSPRMMGAIGASNSGLSLPRQLYPDDPKFSYCISDDLSKTSLIKFGPAAELRGDTLDMVKNLHTSFYYLDVVSVQVNREDIDVRPVVFEMNNNGTRGFIADSTTALTILTTEAFDALKKKIEQFLGPATKYAIFEICYTSSKLGKGQEDKRPIIALEVTDFTLEFEEFRVWQKIPKADIECLQMIRTMSTLSVLGFEQLVNYNIGHDPNNNLMYMEQTDCETAS